MFYLRWLKTVLQLKGSSLEGVGSGRVGCDTADKTVVIRLKEKK